MSRPTVNTVCSKTVTKLNKLDKKILAYEDVRDALGMTKPSTDRYLNNPGYLILRGYLQRVIGGWILTEGSKSTREIIITVTPDNDRMVEEVETTIAEAISIYGKVAIVKTEE